MTAAYRFKGIGWFGGCVIVTLGFYLVSLQVAAERKKLEVLDARIAATDRDIRSLETEFDTRANLTQLERWNGDTLALAAPQASQFVADEAQLAAIDARQPLPDSPAVKTAALVVPSMPVAATAPTAPVTVAAIKPAAAARTVVATVKTRAPMPTRAALVKVAFAPVVDRAAVVMRPAVAMRPKPEVALLDRKLLSDRTLGDLLSGARAEKGHRR